MELAFFAVLFAIIGGLAAGMQSPLASMMSKTVGNMGSVLIAHLGGLIATLLIVIFTKADKLSEWRSVPWYALFAGVFGVAVIFGLNYSIPRIGVGSAVAIFVAAQLGLGVTLDHFGILGLEAHPITLPRVGGLVALILGAWLVSR